MSREPRESNCGHSRRGSFGFAQGSDLKEYRGGIDTWMIVGQEVERHRRDSGQQFVKRGRVRGGRNVVAMAAPHRSLFIPGSRNGENRWLGHGFSVVAVRPTQ